MILVGLFDFPQGLLFASGARLCAHPAVVKVVDHGGLPLLYLCGSYCFTTSPRLLDRLLLSRAASHSWVHFPEVASTLVTISEVRLASQQSSLSHYL